MVSRVSNPVPAFAHVVVDASIAAKWVVREPDSPEAAALLRGWLVAGVQPIAPTFLAIEVANVLHRQARAGVLTRAEAEEALQLVLATVTLRDAPDRDTVRALQIADATGQATPYDALYLALAERAGCEYWTADARFVGATQRQFPQVKQLGGEGEGP